jgi:ribosomal protein S18 acetylase RimI-like enzyme
MNAVCLVPATGLNDEFLLRLYESTRSLEMSALTWAAEQKERFVESQFRVRENHYARSFPNASNLVVYFEQLPVGRMYIDRSDLEIRVIDLALLPEYRGQGIGASLIRNLQLEAMETRRRLVGSVDRFNRAVIFWRRQGFVIDERDPMYLLMEWNPPTVTG